MRAACADDVHQAVIDRITGEWAVLLVGDKELERRVRADDLPDGAEEGSIVEVRVSPLEIEVIGTDVAATDRKRSEMSDRLSRLKRTRSSGRFGTEE